MKKRLKTWGISFVLTASLVTASFAPSAHAAASLNSFNDLQGKLEKTNPIADGLKINGWDEPKENTNSRDGDSGDRNPWNTDRDSNHNSNKDRWKLVFSDEFKGRTIDKTKWGFDIGTGEGGWGNKELEYYTDRTDNAKVQDGRLIITAKKEDYQGSPYTSARMTTSGKHAQKYGKIEVKAKTPAGTGFWPAIWMLPQDNAYGTWASSGEIDIMENKGRLPNTVSGTLHYGEQYPGNTYTGKEYNFPNNGTVEDYHVYAIEWEPGEFRWYVDGVLYNKQNDWYSKSLYQPANNTYPAPFDKPFYLILNLAVGGTFDGELKPDDHLLPKTMEVDYVRMYDLASRPYREPVPPVLPKDNLPDNALKPTADGNLLHNNNFDQDDPSIPNLDNVPNTDYWSLFQGAGGAGTVSVDPINGKNYAKIDISNGGSQPYSVQLLNTISIAKGRFYKVSFDAKASDRRNLTVKVTGGASRGFAGYSQAETLGLTNQMQHYEMMFQMKQDTDIAARTEFNAGLSTSTVWIGNVRLEEIDGITVNFDAPKTPLDGDGNRLYNGTFDQGDQSRLNYWHVNTTGGASAKASVSEAERYLNLKIISAGNGAKNNVDLVQKGLSLIQGQTYQVDFNANASVARSIEVELLSKDGATSYGKQTVSLGKSALNDSASLHPFSFKMTGATDSEAQIVFHLGGQVSTVRMDNIKLVQTSVYIDPSVKLFPLVNGGFDGTMQPWEVNNVDGFASAILANGQAKVSVSTNEGTVPWGVLFLQKGLDLSKGMTYTVEFDANSTIARQIELVLENSSFTRYFDQTVSLDANLKHFKFELKMAKDDLLDIKFLLGRMTGAVQIGATHDILIDNVVVEVKGAKQLANMLTNGTFDSNTDGWGSFFNPGTVTGSLAISEGKELKASLSGSGDQSWHAQVLQNNLALVGGKSYQLTFDAKSTVPRKIQALVEHNGDPYTNYLKKDINLTTEMQTNSFTFTMPADDRAAHVNFLLGMIDGVISQAHDVYFDNVSLVEVQMPPAAPAEGHALLNGTFDSDVIGWDVYRNDGSNAVVSSVYGQMEIHFPDYDGWEKWSTQVYQTGLKLETGKTYELKFDASAVPSKEIKVEILRGDGTTHLLNLQSLTPTVTGATYSYEFTVTGDTEQNAKLAFLLGGNHLDGAAFPKNSKIYLDNIVLAIKP